MAAPPLTPLAAAVLHLDRRPERALVIGCGDGDPVLFLAREFPTARIRGTDRSAALVRAATARVGLDPEGRVAFKQGSARSQPFPAQFFDLVVVVDGSPSPGAVRRVLRPDGTLILVQTRPRGRLGRLLAPLFQGRLRRRGFVAVAPI